MRSGEVYAAKHLRGHAQVTRASARMHVNSHMSALRALHPEAHTPVRCVPQESSCKVVHVRFQRAFFFKRRSGRCGRGLQRRHGSLAHMAHV